MATVVALGECGLIPLPHSALLSRALVVAWRQPITIAVASAAAAAAARKQAVLLLRRRGM